MRRIAGIAAAMLIAFFVMVPVAIAAEPVNDTGRVLISVRGDVDLPAGQQADTVLVVDGTATIEGTATSVVVINGSAVFTGAQVETIVAVRSPIQLATGTVVSGDVKTFDSTVSQAAGATVQGTVSDVAPTLAALGFFLAPAFILLWVGFAVATIAAGLLVAGLASRQVRSAETVMRREPLRSFGVGLVGVIGIPVAAILLMVTVVGAPLGLGVMFVLWPFIAFLGYIVAAVWVGDLLLGEAGPTARRERPYAAVTIGVIGLQVLGIVPILGLLSALATMLGMGALLILSWRTLVTRPVGPQPIVAAPAPMAS
jgi:hypothetical protein